MDLADVSDETIARSYRHLIEFQKDVTGLDSEAGGSEELETVISELAHLHAELQDEVRDRDLDDVELVEETREE